MKYNILNVKDKKKIIEEAKFNGVINTCHKYGISHVNYYNWLKKIESLEESALSQKRKKSSEVNELMKENKKLRKELHQKEVMIQKYVNLVQNYLPRETVEYKRLLPVGF